MHVLQPITNLSSLIEVVLRPLTVDENHQITFGKIVTSCSVHDTPILHLQCTANRILDTETDQFTNRHMEQCDTKLFVMSCLSTGLCILG